MQEPATDLTRDFIVLVPLSETQQIGIYAMLQGAKLLNRQKKEQRQKSIRSHTVLL